MSAFLGPIHGIMYERVRLAAARQRWLREQVEERMAPAQRTELAAALGCDWHRPPEGDLAELVGDAPIHAWLQEQMELTLASEARLLSIVADRPERLEPVLRILADHGRRTGEGLLAEDPAAATDARRLLRHVDRLLLTSMPCDAVSRVLVDDERATIVRRDLLFHRAIWERAGLSDETALAAQEAWIAGFHGALPGVKFLRAPVELDGRRWFDDRVRLNSGA